jgi:hypothetical protein
MLVDDHTPTETRILDMIAEAGPEEAAGVRDVPDFRRTGRPSRR